MNVFALSLLDNADDVRVEGDHVTLTIDGVMVRYRKYLRGFDIALEVTIDGDQYYSNYTPETPQLYEQARLFFETASEFKHRPRRRSRTEMRQKLRIVFGSAVAC